MDPHLAMLAWHFIQTHWHQFVDPVAVGAATESGKQMFMYVANHLKKTPDGARALEDAGADPNNLQAKETIRGLLEKAVQEDPQFASGLSEKLQQAGIQVNVTGENANVVTMQTMLGGTIDMSR